MCNPMWWCIKNEDIVKIENLVNGGPCAYRQNHVQKLGLKSLKIGTYLDDAKPENIDVVSVVNLDLATKEPATLPP